MFPSNSTSHPFSFSDQPFDFQTNPRSKQESDDQFTNLSFFDFPSSPFEDYQFFLNQQQHHDFPEEPQQVVNMNMGGEINKTKVTRMRQGKRDRHSKIKTARGLRDRRMRLSIQVAKRFFHLQDMLGFEKPSQTVEWLLNQAKEEINQVAAETASSTFECELGLSSSPEEVVLNEKQKEEKKLKGVKAKVLSRKISAFHHPFAKVSREKARERARERTKEKMKSKQCELEATNHSLTTQLGSWNL